MKLGLILGVRDGLSNPIPLSDLYGTLIAETAPAEELVFEFVRLPEHCFTEECWTPPPILAATSIASRTSRLRIGTQVICLPFHSLLRLAEDLAVRDNISKGRLDLGVSTASSYQEFVMFGSPIEEGFGRSWEAIGFIEKCFATTDGFTHQGR